MPPPTLTETIVGRACRALVLENDWLSTTILLDQGADIHTLVYKPQGVDVLWKPPRPPREPGVGPPTAGDSLAVWITHYRGGLQTIFPNFGPAVEHEGAPLDFHGEAARTGWQVGAVDVDQARASVTLGVTLLKSPFRIERQMALDAHRPVLSIRETITNDGPDAMDCMWGHHPAFGAPLVSPDSVIDTGARLIETDDCYDVPGNDLPLGQAGRWPVIADRRGEPLDLSRLPAPGSGHSRVLFLKDFEHSWYAITNPALGFGAGLVWDGRQFPYACFWQETGGVRGFPFFGAAYVTAIEPNSSYPGHGLPAVIQKTSTHLVVGPGESRSVELKAVLYSGRRRVSRIDPQGNVWHGS